MRFVCRQRVLKLAVIVLVAVFGLGVLPSSAQAITLSELLNGKDITIDNLRFFNFSFIDLSQGTEADPALITVETVGAGTPNPGLRFYANGNGSLTVTAEVLPSSPPQIQFTRLLYQAETLDGSHLIKDSSLTLLPYSLKIGSQALTQLTQTITSKDIQETIEVKKSLTISGEVEELVGGVKFSSKQNSVSTDTIIVLQAIQKAPEIAQASIAMIEQVFSLAPSLANAGPDQAVLDRVDLDASETDDSLIDPTFEWILVPRDDTVPTLDAEGEKTTVESLENGFYDVTLTVTDQGGVGAKYTDTLVLAAAGPCEAKDSNKLPVNGKLHLWRFKIKKYKYCNWAFARVYGTVDASDLPLDSSIDQDGLTAKVILQVVDKEGNAVGEWSAETAAEMKDRKYKYVIRNKW